MHKFTRITFKLLDLFMIFMMVFGSPMSALAAPSAQDAAPTATDSPTAAPTDTPVSTDTSAPPTDTPVATDTSMPPTDTPVPTDTPTAESTVPPTNPPTPSGPPTIVSDKADYAPGELVTLTGANWTGDTTVTITVVDAVPTVYHDTDQVQVQADGTISDSFNLPTTFVDQYFVTARGAQTGRIATTTFTDLSIGTYDQCSNDTGTGYTTGDTGCRWINGNLQSSNSIYVEGDATVQRLWLTGFTPGTHSVTFDYGTTKGGKHAYDFLTTWNWSETWITVADRCQDISGCTSASETAVQIPNDPNVSDTFEPNTAGARQFVMRGGMLTSASFATPIPFTGSYAGDSDTRITINFTVPSTGAMCATDNKGVTTCDVALWFGAHVSAQANWGLGLGAGSISGSPYHVALALVDNSGGVGSRDNQMQASAVTVIPNGTIVIVKDAVPNDAQDFNFNLNNNSTISQNFSLDDDSDATLSNSQTFSVPPGAWTATELSLPAGWTLTNLVCTDPTNNTTVNLATATSTINLASNETVTCTYTDTFQKANTSTATTIHDTADNAVTSVALGTTVHDSATVSGTGFGTPTGSVTFTFYTTNDQCTGTSVGAGTVTLDASGVAHPSTNQGPLTAGSYSFQATYSGDANYNGSTSLCEPLTVGKASSTTSTAIHDAAHNVVTSVTLGSTVHDQATVSGSGFGTPTGSVTFSFYTASDQCTGTSVGAGTVALDASGVAHPSTSQGPLAAGSYSFQATYSGDANYNGSTSACEPLTVTKAQLTITTIVHDGAHNDITGTSVPFGTNAHDNANVSGGVAGFPIPAISFTFNSSPIANGSTEAGFDATSVSTGPLGAGNYVFKASVASNANYVGATSEDEPFSVSKADSSTTTTIHDAAHNAVTSVALGTTVHDSATVSGIPSLSMNGKIVFQSNRDGNYEIYVMNADGTNQTRLTNNAASDFNPAWSPDGTKIVFDSDRDGNFEIYVMNADGTSQTRLTNNPNSDKTPAWSPDGTKIAFIRSLGAISGDVYVMNSDGSGETNLTNFVPGNFPDTFDVAWSPDGTKIGFSVSLSNTHQEIYLMNANGSGVTQLTNNGVLTFAPDWSPDGTKIAFNRSPAGGAAIYLMNPDGSGQTSLTNNIDGQAAWSPDGTQIVFDSGRDGSGEIYKMNPDGTGQIRLTSNSAEDGNPDWQPLPTLPTGNVAFTFYTANAACTGTSVGAGTATLDASGVAHPSTSQGPLAAGSYSFQATYSGDSNYNGSTSSCEPLTVGKANSTTSTEIHDAAHTVVTSVALGSTVHDQAIVSGTGAGTPTGTVTFTFFTANNACTGASVAAGTVTLDSNGVAHPSTGQGPLAAGSYSFQATYSGDGNYNGSTSPCEPLAVDKSTSTVTTTLHDADENIVAVSGSVALGTSMHDLATVTVSSSFAPTGSVSFTFYANNSCDGDGTDAGNVALDGNNPGAAHPSSSFGPLASGTYSFQAAWGGDANYSGATSACEPFTVNQGRSTVTTTLHKADHSVVLVGGSVPLGTIMHDLATITVDGPFAPAGVINFNFYPNGSCEEGAAIHAGNVFPDGNNPGVAHPSFSFGPLTSGTYSFFAYYTGDDNYPGTTSACEPFTVEQGTSTVVTTLHKADESVVAVGGSVALGTVMHDSATVTASGSFAPTGDVSFTFYSNNACEGDGIAAGTVALDSSGVAHPSDSTTALAAGSYSFRASWAGDVNYPGTTSACEPFTVNKAQLTITTTVHDGSHNDITGLSMPLGTSAHDNAAVSGAVPGFPIPAISFIFNGNPIANSSTESGFDATTVSTSPLGAGNYVFVATVGSNPNYIGVTSADEPFIVNKADSSSVTQIHKANETVVALNSSVPLGTTVHDKVTVSGIAAFTPTGGTRFTFYSNGTCDGTGTASGGGLLDASGVLHPSTSQGSLAAGTYSFRANYNGDANYNGSTSACEPFTVDKAQLTITTEVHNGSHTNITNTSVPLGTSAHDNATVSGGVAGFPIPAISFTFNANPIANGATEGSFNATSVSTGPLGAGNYVFVASVGSNANYIGATSADEPFTVNTADSSTSTQIHNDATHAVITSIGLGGTVHDSASVTDTNPSFNPTGNVSFTWFSNGTCYGMGTTAGTAALSSGVAHPSTAFGPLAAGNYSFQATYIGDNNFNGSTGACEPLTVSKAPTTTSTSAQYKGTKIYRGTAVTDTATVSGAISGFTLTGNVTFFLCDPTTVAMNGGNCSTGGTQVGPAVTLDSTGHATSASTTNTNTDGLYCWRAVYSPDTNTNYTGSSELTSTNECFTVASATIVIQKIIKPVGALTSFNFNVTGPSPYTSFSLAGGQTNTQAGLNAGSYSVTELVPLGWVLTGIGGSTDPLTPYNCTITGSGGSTGVGDLNTQKATITLQLGDTVTCVFENTGQGVTRTQGFWATHTPLANIAWFGGTAFGHTFPGVAGVSGIGDKTLCGRPIDTLGKLMGGFWSDVSKTSTGAKRSALDQVRMQLLQQLLAAELNASAFGTVPSNGSFAAWESAYCGTNQNAIKTAQQQAASFNTAGDSATFTPGTSADSKNARAVANYAFWDILP